MSYSVVFGTALIRSIRWLWSDDFHCPTYSLVKIALRAGQQNDQFIWFHSGSHGGFQHVFCSSSSSSRFVHQCHEYLRSVPSKTTASIRLYTLFSWHGHYHISLDLLWSPDSAHSVLVSNPSSHTCCWLPIVCIFVHCSIVWDQRSSCFGFMGSFLCVIVFSTAACLELDQKSSTKYDHSFTGHCHDTQSTSKYLASELRARRRLLFTKVQYDPEMDRSCTDNDLQWRMPFGDDHLWPTDGWKHPQTASSCCSSNASAEQSVSSPSNWRRTRSHVTATDQRLLSNDSTDDDHLHVFNHETFITNAIPLLLITCISYVVSMHPFHQHLCSCCVGTDLSTRILLHVRPNETCVSRFVKWIPTDWTCFVCTEKFDKAERLRHSNVALRPTTTDDPFDCIHALLPKDIRWINIDEEAGIIAPEKEIDDLMRQVLFGLIEQWLGRVQCNQEITVEDGKWQWGETRLQRLKN